MSGLVIKVSVLAHERIMHSVQELGLMNRNVPPVELWFDLRIMMKLPRDSYVTYWIDGVGIPKPRIIQLSIDAKLKSTMLMDPQPIRNVAIRRSYSRHHLEQ